MGKAGTIPIDSMDVRAEFDDVVGFFVDDVYLEVPRDLLQRNAAFILASLRYTKDNIRGIPRFKTKRLEAIPLTCDPNGPVRRLTTREVCNLCKYDRNKHCCSDLFAPDLGDYWCRATLRLSNLELAQSIARNCSYLHKEFCHTLGTVKSCHCQRLERRNKVRKWPPTFTNRPHLLAKLTLIVLCIILTIYVTIY
jgi:hypothetical protein